MVIVRSISPTQVQVDGRTFSRQSFDIAQSFLQNKLAGRRGTLVNPSGDFDQDASRIADLLRLDPQLQSAIESASRLRARALESGFASTEEFTQVSGAFSRTTREAPRFVSTKEGIKTEQQLARERQQLLDIQKFPMSIRQDLSKQPSSFQRALAGDIGEQVIGVRTPFRPQLFPLERPQLTAKEIQTTLKQFGLPSKVVAEFIPTTPLDIAIIGATLPLLAGLGGKAAQLVTSGVISGIGAFTAIDKNLPLETRVAGGLVAIAPLLIKLRVPKGKKGESRFALLTEELEGKVVKKKKKVLDLNIIAEELSTKPTNQAKIEDIRKILKEISKTKDPLLREAQFKEATNLFKKAHGKEGAKSLLNDFIQQEGAILQKQIPVAQRGVPTIPTKKLVGVLTPTRLKEIKRITNAKTKQQDRITFSQKPLGERYAESQKLSPKERQRLRQKIAIITRPSQLTKQAIAQAQAQRQLQKQAQRLKSATKLIQLLQPQLTFAQARAQAKAGLRKKGLFPKIIPIPKLEGKVKKKKIKKKLPFPISKQGYNVFGKPLKQKKFKRLNKTPITKAKAKDLGAWLVDHSLGRTFKIKPTSKKAQKPKLKVPASYFSKTKHKFRDFKRIKGKKIKIRNTWIEKKGKPLLDTRAERSKITLLAKLSRLKKKSLPKRRKK